MINNIYLKEEQDRFDKRKEEDVKEKWERYIYSWSWIIRYNFFHLFIIFIYIYTFFDLFALLATRSQHYRRGLSKSMHSVLSRVFFFSINNSFNESFCKGKTLREIERNSNLQLATFLNILFAQTSRNMSTVNRTIQIIKILQYRRNRPSMM